MTSEQPEDRWRLWIKIAFVLFCCVCGGGFVYLSTGGSGGGEASPSIAPFITRLGIASLTMVALASLWLGKCGKLSASWAVLAYGSWMVIPCIIFFYLLWYGQNHLTSSWFGYLIEGVILTVLIQGGISTALRGQWLKLGLWWLGSLILMFFLFPQWMYASYEGYKEQEQIQPSAVVTPATQATPLPKAPSGKQITIL